MRVKTRTQELVKQGYTIRQAEDIEELELQSVRDIVDTDAKLNSLANEPKLNRQQIIVEAPEMLALLNFLYHEVVLQGCPPEVDMRISQLLFRLGML